MYSSHFNLNNKRKLIQINFTSQIESKHKQKSPIKNNKKSSVVLKKTIPQYLFLNLVKNLSILYLILTILNIPVYIGVVQLSQVYYQQNQKNQLSVTDYIMETTLFAMHQNFANSTIMNFNFFNNHQIKTNDTKQSNKKNSNRISFNSFNFSWTLQQFNTFIVWYFYIMSIIFAIGLSLIQINNRKLYLRLKFGQKLYQVLRCKKKSKLSQKQKNEISFQDISIQRENFHIISISNIPFLKDWPLYILIPKILAQIKQRMENNYKITNYKFKQPKIRIKIKKVHQEYLRTIHRINNLQMKAKRLHQKIKNKQGQFTENNPQQQLEDILSQLKHLELVKIKAKINLDSITQLRHVQEYKNCYYQPFLFLKFDSILNVPSIQIIKKLKVFRKIQQILLQENHQYQCFKKANKMSDFSIMFQRLQINRFEIKDCIYQNYHTQNQYFQRIPDNFQNSTSSLALFFIKFYKFFERLSFKKHLNIIFAYLISIVLVLGIDIVILIIEKSNIFSYATSLITLILQILLKGKIILISNLQRHKLWSHLHLSIFIKLTLLLYFNLCLLLIIGNYDWTTLWMKNVLSKNFVKNIGDLEWYSRVGVTLILLLIIQTLYCTIRVYIQIGKSLLFGFVQARISTFSISRLPSRLKSYLQQFQTTYVKPIIDLQICYSHILAVYLTGITFSYPYPILYPLMLIFSLLIYSTHVKYVEFHTQKLMYNGQILLNNASIRFLFLGSISSTIIMKTIQSKKNIFQLDLLLVSAIILGIMIITQIYIRIHQKNLQVRLFEIKTNQTQSQQIKNLRICDEFEKNSSLNNQQMINQEEDENVSFIQMEQKKQELLNIQLEIMALKIFHKQNCLNEVHNQYFLKYQNILMRQYNQLSNQMNIFQSPIQIDIQ